MRTILLALISAVLGGGAAQARPAEVWAPSWSTANYGLEQEALLPQNQLADATLRQTVRLSTGGGRIRFILTNENGDAPLQVGSVHVALAGPAGSASTAARTDHEVRFGGRTGIVISPGSTATSDAVAMHVRALARLSVSIHLISAPAAQTGHLRSLSTSWVAQGDHAGAQALVGGAGVDHWYFLSAVETPERGVQVIVPMGDSITDGSLSTLNANARYPDRLGRTPRRGAWKRPLGGSRTRGSPATACWPTAAARAR